MLFEGTNVKLKETKKYLHCKRHWKKGYCERADC